MKRLKELRANKSQTYIANKIGLNQRAYSNYENGTREADYETLKKIADYFHVSVDYLLGREEQTPIENNQSIDDFLNSLKWDNLTDEQKNLLARLVYGAEVERLEKEKKEKK